MWLVYWIGLLYSEVGNLKYRKGIERCDISMHPYGLPHGPQPGMTEASIGKKETQELAVMVDTFYPLNLTTHALEMEKPEYMSTWLEGSGE